MPQADDQRGILADLMLRHDSASPAEVTQGAVLVTGKAETVGKVNSKAFQKGAGVLVRA
jgi:hypothetical protein